MFFSIFYVVRMGGYRKKCGANFEPNAKKKIRNRTRVHPQKSVNKYTCSSTCKNTSNRENLVNTETEEDQEEIVVQVIEFGKHNKFIADI